jgi:eukaryotic-like serine/threonine-protein kinase
MVPLADLNTDRQTDADPVLCELMEQMTQRVQSGEEVNLAAFVRQYPRYAEPLQKMALTLQVLRDLAQPSSAEAAEGADVRHSPATGSFLTAGTLGDYRIFREIGRGGMGIVYEAEQVSLSRRVALKVLPFASMLDRRQLQRFQNEARAAASLQHPNIVQVHHVGCEQAVHYYTMDYIEGQTLAELIRHLRQRKTEDGGQKTEDGGGRAEAGGEGGQAVAGLAAGRFAPRQAAGSSVDSATEPYAYARTVGVTAETVGAPEADLPTERSTKGAAYFRSIAEIGMRVAEALDHAHQHGVIHRDVKPSNVILDHQGKPWVTDFGLAHVEGDATLTVSGDVLGTLRYMSPEQALAKRIAIDHRTDVYSLGATLYELLTLEPVFSGQDRQELLRQIAFEDPKPPRKWNKAVPAEMEIVVCKAMAKSPAERYDTAQELADDLRRFLEDRPIRARRPTLVQRSVKWSRRHKPVVAATAVLLILATLGVAASTWLITAEKARTRSALHQSRIAEWQARLAEDNERKAAQDAQRLQCRSQQDLQRARDNLQRALAAADRLGTCLENERFFAEPDAQELRRAILHEAWSLLQVALDDVLASNPDDFHHAGEFEP